MSVDARNQALQKISLANSQIGHGQFHDAITSLNIAGELAQQAQAADILSVVYGTLGNVYQSAGRFDDALENCTIALKIQEDLVKHDPVFNEWISTALNNLGALLRNMGKPQDAKNAYERALEMREALLKGEPGNVVYQSDVAMTLNNLANLLSNMGKQQDAKNAYERALEMREALLKGEPGNVVYQSWVATTLNNLGLLLSNMGKLQDAKNSFERALEMHETLLKGEPSNVVSQSDVATTLNNLGLLLSNMGKLQDAKNSFERALEMRETLLKGEPGNVVYQSWVATTLNNLGLLLSNMGKQQDAKNSFERSLEMREALLKGEPSNVVYQSLVATTLNNLGLPLSNIGKPQDAKNSFERALEMREALLKEEPGNVVYQSWVATTLNNLGALLSDMGKPDDAKEAYERALKMREKSLGIFTEPLQYMTINAKSRTIISIIQLYSKIAQIAENRATRPYFHKSVYDFYQFHRAFFSDYHLDYEGKIAKEAGLGAYIYYLMLIAGNETQTYKRIQAYGNCELEIEKIYETEGDENLKNLWFSQMHYLKGRKLVNEALGSETAPPDKEKLKLAVEIFKLAKEKYKPANVCYCVYKVLLELQSIDHLDEETAKRLTKLLETAMNNLPDIDKTVKPVFLEIMSLIENPTVKMEADLFVKLNTCITKIDHIALRVHLNATYEKLISYLKEPFSPEVSYRNWMISIASIDHEKIQGKLIIKAGDREIFNNFLDKQKSLDIPYRPDKKHDTLTFITANQKSVTRPISFHERIKKDRDFIWVHYLEHDCKRSIYNDHFRVAIVQLKYGLVQDSNVVKIIHHGRYFKKVTSILKAVTGKADLVVFPEFSIPFDYLAELKKHSEKYNVIIVAGSHYVTSENLNKYDDLFYDRIGEDDKRKNISPVIIPGSKILHTEKILGAGLERNSFGEAGMTNGTLNRIFKLCNNVTFGVMVCFDFLNDDLRQLTSDACDVILVPQTNPGTKRFHKVGKIELENPRSSGNKAYVMASGIFNFGDKKNLGGDSGLFLTLDKSSQNNNSIIEPIDNVKEQFIQIADINTDFYAARDIQNAQVAVTTQLIHIFEEHEIRGSGKGNPEGFLKALDEIESAKEVNEIIKLLNDNAAVIKNYSPLMHSNISGNKLDNLRFDEIKDRCSAIVIK